MAGRNAAISVSIKGESDFTSARREAARALDQIGDLADDTTDDIRRAFDNLSPELDTSEIRKALDLASQLDGMAATFDLETSGLDDIKQMEALAKSLRGFQARVDLSVEGREELKDALGLADKMDGIRRLKVELQGQEDLKRAAEIADDLERRRTVPIDARAEDLQRLDDELTAAGERGAEGISDALGDIDFGNIGGSGLDQMIGAIGAAGPWAAVAGTVAAVFGDEFADGFNSKLSASRDDQLRALRFNLSDAELAAIGEAGGEAYSSGLAAGLTDAKDAAAQLQGELGRVDDNLDLTEATRQAMALEQVFGTDMADSIAAVQKLVARGLVADSVEGFNLLFELADQTKGRFDEALEVATEFAPAFDSLGIQGPQALNLIGQAFEKNIFEQTDQAGEVFSEFNEIIRTGGAADALELIGLKAEDMQDQLARGEGAEVMSTIAEKLLAMPDPAQRAAAAAEIFGDNMSTVADPDIALQLFAQADGIRAVGDGASSAADDLEGMVSPLDRLKRAAGEAASELAILPTIWADLASGDFRQALDELQGLAADIVNPFDVVGRALGTDIDLGPLSDLSDKIRGVGAASDELPPKLASARDGLKDTADAGTELAGGLDEAAASADELEAELRGLFDFSADQLMRDVAGAADDLADSLSDGGLKAIDMSGGIDISTEAGRRLQEQMEGLNGVLVDASVAAANNDITAEQLAATQTYLAGEFDRVAKAAGLTEDQASFLRDTYLNIDRINEISTDFNANTQGAIDNVTALKRAIDGIKNKSVTISASISGPTGVSASGTITRKARGGWTEGLTLVGEEGPELIDVRGRAFVHTAAETRELMSNRGGLLGGAPGSVGPQRVVNFNGPIVVDKGRDLWAELTLMQQVYGG